MVVSFALESGFFTTHHHTTPLYVYSCIHERDDETRYRSHISLIATTEAIWNAALEELDRLKEAIDSRISSSLLSHDFPHTVPPAFRLLEPPEPR
jgi:hypothetical protein